MIANIYCMYIGFFHMAKLAWLRIRKISSSLFDQGGGGGGGGGLRQSHLYKDQTSATEERHFNPRPGQLNHFAINLSSTSY